jgi:glycine cleavage system H lipoate-binding protein
VKLRLLVCALLAALPVGAVKVGITQIAAGTTIGINLLEIKSTLKKTRAAAKVVKVKVVKVAKKVAGKK